MNANELADELDDIDAYEKHQTLLGKASDMLRKQAEEIEYWKDKFNKAMQMQEPKPAKYTDAWWKEVEEFNKRLKEKKND
jgi:hypothetical protein